MKILIVEPTDSKLMARSLELRGNTLEPYACEILAAYLEKNVDNINVEVIQQRDLSDIDLIDVITGKDPDIIGFSVLTCNYPQALKLSKAIKRRNEKIIIVFGGQHPSIDVESVIDNSYVDFVVFGEGEITFKELVYSIKNKRNNYSEIEGLAYKENGQSKINRPRKRISNLDELPYAKRSLEIIFDSKNWNICYPSSKNQTGVVQLQYSRGCNDNCSFCITPHVWNKQTTPVRGNKVTYRSPDNVVNEILEIRKNNIHPETRSAINFFYFNDVTFNSNKTKMRALCKEIIKNNLHQPHENISNFSGHTKSSIHWFCLVKVGIDDLDAKLLSDAGCSKIGVGIESFDEEIVKKKYGKKYNMENVEKTLINCDKYGIINRVYIVIGSPWESQESIKKIKKKILEYPVDHIRVAFAVPYKGSPAYASGLWEMEDGITEEDMTEDKPVVKCKNYTRNELIEIRDELVISFYNSVEYRNRVANKKERFPFLEESYQAFDEELQSLSSGKINIFK